MYQERSSDMHVSELLPMRSPQGLPVSDFLQQFSLPPLDSPESRPKSVLCYMLENKGSSLLDGGQEGNKYLVFCLSGLHLWQHQILSVFLPHSILLIFEQQRDMFPHELDLHILALDFDPQDAQKPSW